MVPVAIEARWLVGDCDGALVNLSHEWQPLQAVGSPLKSH